MGSWPSDPAVQAYVEERLQRGIYKGIGEFHLSATQAEAPTVRRFAELAAQQQLFFMPTWTMTQSQNSCACTRRCAFCGPVLGCRHTRHGRATPGAICQPLGRASRCALMSRLGAGSIPPGRRFFKYPDRFMVGTDTWTTSRWDDLGLGMQSMSGWLNQLPRDVAERIAYRNAERLFGNP